MLKWTRLKVDEIHSSTENRLLEESPTADASNKNWKEAHLVCKTCPPMTRNTSTAPAAIFAEQCYHFLYYCCLHCCFYCYYYCCWYCCCNCLNCFCCYFFVLFFCFAVATGVVTETVVKMQQTQIVEGGAVGPTVVATARVRQQTILQTSMANDVDWERYSKSNDDDCCRNEQTHEQHALFTQHHTRATGVILLRLMAR